MKKVDAATINTIDTILSVVAALTGIGILTFKYFQSTNPEGGSGESKVPMSVSYDIQQEEIKNSVAQIVEFCGFTNCDVIEKLFNPNIRLTRDKAVYYNTVVLDGGELKEPCIISNLTNAITYDYIRLYVECDIEGIDGKKWVLYYRNGNNLFTGGTRNKRRKSKSKKTKSKLCVRLTRRR
jgi:hypothetical protein